MGLGWTTHYHLSYKMTADRQLKLAIDLASLGVLVLFILSTSPAAMHKLQAHARWVVYYLALAQYNAAHVTRASAPTWLREAMLVRGRAST